MSKSLIRHAAALGLAAGIGLTGLAAGAADDDPIAAVVDGEVIRRSHLEAQKTTLPAHFQAVPLAVIYNHIRDRAIELRLVLAEARETGIEQDEEVMRRLEESRRTILQDVFIQRYLDERITEEELRRRYDILLPTIPRPEEVRARHILVDSEDEARAIIAEIQAGADFAEVAKARSQGPTAADGGDIGYAGRDSLMPAFAELAFSLEAGQMADRPAETQFGWHVVMIEDKRQAPPPSIEEVRDGLADEITRDAIAELLRRLSTGAKIERFNYDGTPVGAE